jgi:predicted DNA-binding protein with PD1-like motif
MDYKKVDGRHIIARLDKGEEIIASLRCIAECENIKLAMVQGLGAVNDIVIGVFDVESKQYKSNAFKGNFEIVSLTGTIDQMKGNYYSHFHISVGDENGHVLGGHMNQAIVSATGEIIITLLDGEIDREFSEEVGLNLIQLH